MSYGHRKLRQTIPYYLVAEEAKGKIFISLDSVDRTLT